MRRDVGTRLKSFVSFLIAIPAYTELGVVLVVHVPDNAVEDVLLVVSDWLLAHPVRLWLEVVRRRTWLFFGLIGTP